MAVDPRRVLVIGAGPGLGTAVARRFAREGFAVTLAARHPAVPAGELHGADTVVADAAEPHAFRAVLTELAESTAPGVVVYNAAVITTDNILGAGTDHLLHAYAVDVLGAVIAAQVFTPAMRRARSGTFLATGGNPDPSHASLSLGKAALRAAVALMHDELKADGVHAGSVTVGGTITPGTPFDPDRIAETYWELHTQPADAWAAETYFEG
ncbi:SDR family NAD(P)-dependent oxidoreductase [Actinoplanes sp. NPDC051343]|jgi:NAD(P)-dependent dehydrogenase (short-subunit alcohol dehydrogenase family)|uniref:SDR family NAD(P)-dependent oxidoreductase n=1 Tax=Actinoplanes sp. NPDC051343 TaxID=3363906 RepID=UPI00379FA5A7